MSKPIRILHCVVNMNRGGAETLIMNIYRNVDRNRIQFDFLTSREGVFDNEIKEMGGRVYRIPYITEIGPFKYARLLRAFFKENHEYKILHCHMDRTSGVVLREAAKTGIPVRIAHSHSTKSEGNITNRLVKAYYAKYIGKCATHKFACSEVAARFLFKNSNNIILLKNGIQTEKYRYNQDKRTEIRKMIGVDDKFVIGHIGRFSEPKNHIFLLKIFNELCQKRKDSVLCLIGSGKLEGSIKKMAVKFGIDESVVFLGSRPNVWEYLNAFDVFCFPSLYEGFPIAVLEAQASGLKCIVSDVISNEINVTENVENISLKEPATVWAEKIVENMHYDRIDMTTTIKAAGYDIADIAVQLQEYYESIQKNIESE